MSFLDTKDPSKRVTLVKVYVIAMKNVKQRNLVIRVIKLVIGHELQNSFPPNCHVTKQAAEETRKELAPIKKTLMDIDGAVAAQGAPSRSSPNKNTDMTFGIHKKRDGQISMGNIGVQIDVNGKTLTIDDIEYKLTQSLVMLTT